MKKHCVAVRVALFAPCKHRITEAGGRDVGQIAKNLRKNFERRAKTPQSGLYLYNVMQNCLLSFSDHDS